MITDLEEHTEDREAIGRLCSFREGVVFTRVPMHQVQL